MPFGEGHSPSLSENESIDPNREDEEDVTVSRDDEKNESTTGAGINPEQTSNNPAATVIALAGSSGSSASNASEGAATAIFPRDLLQTADDASEKEGGALVLSVSALEQLLTDLTENVVVHQFRPQEEKLDDALTQVKQLTERIKSLEESRQADQQKLLKSVGTGLQEGLVSVEERVTEVIANRRQINTSNAEASSVTPAVDLDGQLASSPFIQSIVGRLDRLEGQIELLNLSYNRYQLLPRLIEELTGRVEALERDKRRLHDQNNETKDNCKGNRFLIRKGEKEREALERRHERVETQVNALGDGMMHQGQQVADVTRGLEDVRQGLENVVVNNITDFEPGMDPAGNPADPINAADDGEDGVEVEGVDAEQEWQQ